MSAKVFKLQHHNGLAANSNAASTTPVTLKVSQLGHGLWVVNLDATNNLLLSFDLGHNYFTILPKTTIRFEALFNNLVVASSASTVDYNIVTEEG